jgi:hypothetical protein
VQEMHGKSPPGKADECTTDEARGTDGDIVQCDEQSERCAQMVGVQSGCALRRCLADPGAPPGAL